MGRSGSYFTLLITSCAMRMEVLDASFPSRGGEELVEVDLPRFPALPMVGW